MNKEEIFEVLKRNIIEVLDEVKEERITLEGKLKDLGANSIDRVEIVTMTSEDLNVCIPAEELKDIQNIDGLVNKLYEKAE